MKKVFVSKQSRLVPSKASRSFHVDRNSNYTPEKFQTYNDWFYFIHIDPYIRWVHAFGMIVGVFLYVISFYEFLIFGLGLAPVIKFLLGMFFFYFLPLISHHIYDGGSIKTPAGKLIPTLIPVIHINFLTITGRYDNWLRNFIKKYPFTIEAWQLEERDN